MLQLLKGSFLTKEVLKEMISYQIPGQAIPILLRILHPIKVQTITIIKIFITSPQLS